MNKPLAGKEVLLGITGSVAAYKSAELVRVLRELGAGVTAVMTASGARFVTPLTFGALTGRPVLTGLFDGVNGGTISHIELTKKADAVVVAPATANIIGKLACGIADDLLSTLLMAANCPVLIAPAMNCRMYESAAVKANIKTLKARGVGFIGPEKGPMACEEYGWGRMSEPADIAAAVERVLAGSGRLSGMKVLVSAGPTVEDIDPVRFISNRSSGKMGYAIAEAAAALGADVTLVSGPARLEPPAGVATVAVRSAAQMESAVKGLAGDADVVIMAAAVADYAPEKPSGCKLKKGGKEISMKLVRTPDIIAGLGASKKKGQLLVGFAAETDDLEKNALKKLAAKKLDIIAANPVGPGTGFDGDYNILKVYGKGGLLLDTGRVTKSRAAFLLMDLISEAADRGGRMGGTQSN